LQVRNKIINVCSGSLIGGSKIKVNKVQFVCNSIYKKNTFIVNRWYWYVFTWHVLQIVSEGCVSLADSVVSRAQSLTANGSHIITPTAQPSSASLMPENVSDTDLHEPDNKRLKMSVFGSYSKIRSQTQIAAPKKNVVPIADLVQRYLCFVDTISHTQQEAGTLPWSLIQSNSEYAPLKPLFEYVYSAPCTSAPVERIFSHGGIFMWPHRASMSDRV